MRARSIDQLPASVICRGYQGDPFDWGLDLILEDGTPGDLDGWTWQGWIEAGDGVVIPWICTPDPHGVSLYLRGQDTLRLPSSYCPFDVTGRDPEAGEGHTVVRGSILCQERVTPPLRGWSPGTVAPHPELVTL
jgi:hypothetical protein